MRDMRGNFGTGDGGLSEKHDVGILISNCSKSKCLLDLELDLAHLQCKIQWAISRILIPGYNFSGMLPDPVTCHLEPEVRNIYIFTFGSNNNRSGSNGFNDYG